MSGEIDEAHGPAVAGRYLHIPAEMLLERISQRDGALRCSRGKDGAGERLRDRADAEDAIAIRSRVRSRCDLAEAGNGAFTIAHGADDEAGDLVRQKGHGTGELHRLLEQSIVRRRPRRERTGNSCREDDTA